MTTGVLAAAAVADTLTPAEVAAQGDQLQGLLDRMSANAVKSSVLAYRPARPEEQQLWDDIDFRELLAGSSYATPLR